MAVGRPAKFRDVMIALGAELAFPAPLDQDVLTKLEKKGVHHGRLVLRAGDGWDATETKVAVNGK